MSPETGRGEETAVDRHTSADPTPRQDGSPPRPPRRGADDRSIPDLLRELSSEGSELMRQEVELAKAEMREKVETYRRGVTKMAAGGGLLLAALLTLLWTVNRGLTSLLAQVVSLEVAAWLSPLILTVGLGGIGLALLRSGSETIQDEGLTPDRTTASLAQDKRWAERKVRQVKEEIKNG